MCNMCNSCFNFGRSTCGYTNYGCGLWGGNQTLCREGNSNFNVGCGRTNGCGNTPCGCYQHTCNCGCGGTSGTSGNGNGNGTGNGGRFVCVTVCGNAAVGTNTAGGDLYYARQYGLHPFGYQCGCGCTLDVVRGIGETL